VLIPNKAWHFTLQGFSIVNEQSMHQNYFLVHTCVLITCNNFLSLLSQTADHFPPHFLFGVCNSRAANQTIVAVLPKKCCLMVATWANTHNKTCNF
jgi:hypothetical protein